MIAVVSLYFGQLLGPLVLNPKLDLGSNPEFQLTALAISLHSLVTELVVEKVPQFIHLLG